MKFGIKAGRRGDNENERERKRERDRQRERGETSEAWREDRRAGWGGTKKRTFHKEAAVASPQQEASPTGLHPSQNQNDSTLSSSCHGSVQETQKAVAAYVTNTW